MFPAAMQRAKPVEQICCIWTGTVTPYPVCIVPGDSQPRLYGDGFNREWYFVVGEDWIKGAYPWRILLRWQRDVRRAREFERVNYGW